VRPLFWRAVGGRPPACSVFRQTALDGDLHIVENGGRLVRLAEFHAVPSEATLDLGVLAESPSATGSLSGTGRSVAARAYFDALHARFAAAHALVGRRAGCRMCSKAASRSSCRSAPQRRKHALPATRRCFGRLPRARGPPRG
jgi:hypothetical protein